MHTHTHIQDDKQNMTMVDRSDFFNMTLDEVKRRKNILFTRFKDTLTNKDEMNVLAGTAGKSFDSFAACHCCSVKDKPVDVNL